MAYGLGLLGGLSKAIDTERGENRRRAEETEKRELALLTELAKSPDSEIAARAGAGLLDLASGRRVSKKGLAGWLGEIEGSPYLGSIREMLTVAPPTPGAAALPDTTPVTSPATDADVGGDLPPAKPAPSVRAGGPPAGPRRLFPDTRSEAYATYYGREKGEQDAQVQLWREAGLSEEEIQQLLQADVMGKQPNFQLKWGEDADGNRVSGIFNPRTGVVEYPEGHALAGQPIPGFRPVTRGTARPVAGRNAQGQQTFAIWDPTLQGFRDPNTGQPMEGFLPANQTLPDKQYVARQLFPGVPFERLSPEQAALVELQLEQEAARAAALKTTTTGQAQIAIDLDTPLPESFVKEQGLAIGTTKRMLLGQVPRAAQEAERELLLSQVEPLIEEINRKVDTVFPDARGFIGGVRTAAELTLDKLTRDPNYAALQADIGRAQSLVARLIALNLGAQSEGDARRALIQLANLEPGFLSGDVRDTARAKVLSTLQAIRSVRATLRPRLTPNGAAAVPGAPPSKPGGQPPTAASPEGVKPGDIIEDPTQPGVMVRVVAIRADGAMEVEDIEQPPAKPPATAPPPAPPASGAPPASPPPAAGPTPTEQALLVETVAAELRAAIDAARTATGAAKDAALAEVRRLRDELQQLRGR